MKKHSIQKIDNSLLQKVGQHISLTNKLLREHNSNEKKLKLNDEFINHSFLTKNFRFINSIFSTHYPFTNEQIIKFKDKLCWGGCVYSFYDQDYMHLYQSSPGISFNSLINWNKTLKEIGDFDCNHIAATWWEEDNFPLVKKTEVKRHEYALIDSIASTCTRGEEFAEIMVDIDYEGIEKKFNQQYSTIQQDEIKKIIKDFEEKKPYTKALILNQTFYNTLINQINNAIDDFDVATFYKNTEVRRD